MNRTSLRKQILARAALLALLPALAACAARPEPASAPAASAPAAAVQPAALARGSPAAAAPKWGVVIHGGAGTIRRETMSAEREAAYHAALTAALRAGHGVLATGGTSMDAVQAAINVMEDSPLFNAGKGAVFTSEGKNEMDAAMMDGRTRMAGAIASVTHVKNPINLARLVMQQSPHVMMVGEGAETFGRAHGVQLVPESYFYTEDRWRSLERARQQEAAADTARRTSAAEDARDLWDSSTRRFGTVGAVALDRQGNLAAGTSTGGMTNKRWGRVGDAPIIGAGTFADNRCAGISATGHGEFFIRSVVAYDICALMMYRGMSVAQATNEVVMRKLVEFGGEGGVIAMDREGNVAMPFNSEGMYRGYIGPDGEVTVEIYRD